MNLIPDDIRVQLLANGERARTDASFDLVPVVKLFTPDAGATWLLTELDPQDPDRAFGLCDLGLGFPELGWVSIAQLQRVLGPAGAEIERDLYFRADKPISDYARQARIAGRIVT
jgi:hypothetical protein